MDDVKKGTQLLEVYALEIQMYTEQKNSKKLKTLYEQSLHIKSAIPHPLIMGVIRGEEEGETGEREGRRKRRGGGERGKRRGKGKEEGRVEDGEEERRENGEDKRERGEGKEEWKRRGGGGGERWGKRGRGEEEHVCVHVHVREKEGKSTTFSLPLLEKLRGE